MNRDWSQLRSERGSVTYWMLGLTLLLLTVGGLAVDLWGLVAERRELAVTVDAAAAAAATAVDEEVWRSTGTVVLQPDLARSRALDLIAAQPIAGDVQLPAGWLQVGEASATVTLETVAELTLLRLSGLEEVTLRASATAEAQVDG